MNAAAHPAPTEISVEREIAAPADVLWSMISDVTRMGSWSPETTACSWLRGATGPVLGAKFKGVNSNGSKTWSTTCTVTAVTPGERFAFRVDVGPIKVAGWEYRFEAAGDRTRVVETWTDRRAGFVKRLGKPLSGVDDRIEHNRAGMVETLARLATAAEH